MKFNSKKFSDAISEKRKNISWTVRECESHLALSRATFYYAEHNKKARGQRGYVPDVITYARVCKWLNTPMETFFTSK